MCAHLAIATPTHTSKCIIEKPGAKDGGPGPLGSTCAWRVARTRPRSPPTACATPTPAGTAYYPCRAFDSVSRNIFRWRDHQHMTLPAMLDIIARRARLTWSVGADTRQVLVRPCHHAAVARVHRAHGQSSNQLYLDLVRLDIETEKTTLQIEWLADCVWL